MAKAQTADDFQEDPERKRGGNGLDPALTKGFVGRIERLYQDLESERGQYMQRCKTIRGSIKVVIEEAEIEGIPKRELKAVIKARVHERKAANCRSDLEGDEVETFDMIVAALGDLAGTPLGDTVLAGAAH